jgi:hypothetical protein
MCKQYALLPSQAFFVGSENGGRRMRYPHVFMRVTRLLYDI